MDAEKPIEGYQKAIAQVCRALAKSIDAGNNKGRAIANEALQLANLLATLAGVEPDAIDSSDIPKETQALIDALATPPRLDSAPASD